MTIEQAQSWVGRDLTPNETELVAFLRGAIIKGDERVLVCSAWAKVEPSILDTPIPKSALDQVYGEDVVEALTLREFSLLERIVEVEEGDNYALFILSANYNVLPAGKSRVRYTNADDVKQWLGLTAPFGIGIDDLLTDAEVS